MATKQCVLITGTTSGVGKALLEQYYKKNWDIICVNRRIDPEMERKYSTVLFEVLDISSYIAVSDFLKDLQNQNRFPDLIVLNAGINRPDNSAAGFDYSAFQDVLSTNLLGTMSFIAAARSIKKSGITYLGISSVSNIVPNPGHAAYAISKKAIFDCFRHFQKNDSANSYKVVILGPVPTNIMRNHELPNWQKKIFIALSHSAEKTAIAITQFAESRNTTLRFPLKAYLFYSFVRWPLKALPFLYRGTR